MRGALCVRRVPIGFMGNKMGVRGRETRRGREELNFMHFDMYQ